jgi:SAM-dependent methyltransferase
MTDPLRPDEPVDDPNGDRPTMVTTPSPAPTIAMDHSPTETGEAPKPVRPAPPGDDTDHTAVAPHEPTPGTTPEPGAVKKTRPKMKLRIPDDEVARPKKPPPAAASQPAVSAAPASSAATSAAALSSPAVSAQAPSSAAPSPALQGSVSAVTTHRIITLSVGTPGRPPTSSTGTGPHASLRDSRPPPADAPGRPPSIAPPAAPRPPSIAPPAPVEDLPPEPRHSTSPSPPPAALNEDSWTPYQPTVADMTDDTVVAVDIPIDTGSFAHEPAALAAEDALPEEPTYEPVRELPRVAPTALVTPAAGAPARPSSMPDRAEAEDARGKAKDDDVPPDVSQASKPVEEDSADDPFNEERATLPRLPVSTTVRTGPHAPRPFVSVVSASHRSRNDAVLDAEEISVDSEPPVDAELPVESEPPVASDPTELAEIAPEDVVSVEAVHKDAATQAAVASLPPMRPRLASVPGAPPVPAPPAKASRPAAQAMPTATVKTSTVPEQGPTPPKPPPVMTTATVKTSTVPEHAPPPPKPRPMLIVPPASPLAPPPMNEAGAASRKRVRPWWEELFNDDFIRTMAKITDAQIAREVDFIEESLGLAKGAMVLDLACGTGRHAIELTRRGYEVVGFDLSLAMLAKAADEAQDRDQKINFVQGDMREMTFDGTFDGIYCWNTSFGYFEEEKNAAVIANVRRALKPNGQVLLDVINRDYAANDSPSLAWFEGDGCVCMDEMTIDWITSRMKVKRTMMMDDGRSREIEYSIRIYALHELGKLLHDNGFRVSQVSGRISTPGVFFGANSPRTLILAEKK